MVDGAMPKPLGDLARIFFLAMAAGGLLLGWLNNRGRRGHRGETSGDGSDSDDGLRHGSWWGLDDADGGHGGDTDGDAGHWA